MSNKPPETLLTQAENTLKAVQILRQFDSGHRPLTSEQSQTLQGFSGWGPIALSAFPDPVKGTYKSVRWQAIGEQLQNLLSPQEYASARRAVFSQFLTSPLIIRELFAALKHLGVPDDCHTLEPGCGPGRFLVQAPHGMRFTAVELETISGRIAKTLYGEKHDIRIESFEKTTLKPGSIDAVISNPPFGDVHVEYAGQRFSLHEFFIAKSLDALHPGGILAVVMTHSLMDKEHDEVRQYLSGQADLLGAVRLPKEAFQNEGTSVICDLLMLQRRAPGDVSNHRAEWCNTFSIPIDGVDVPINGFFHAHPENVLGSFTRQDTLWGSEQSYSVLAYPNWEDRLQAAILKLPKDVYYGGSSDAPHASSLHVSIPVPLHVSGLTEGSFFTGEDLGIYQIQLGEAAQVLANSKPLTAKGSLAGQRLAHLIRLRDAARTTLHAQNQGASEQECLRTRGLLNLLYDSFVATYGPINKTVISQTSKGTLIRRMPNLAVFRDDPDAVLVMALESYDEETNMATKAAMLEQDVVGHLPLVTHASTAEQALLICLDQEGRINIDLITQLTGKNIEEILDALDDLIYQDPTTQEWVTADVYLSGNVRAKLVAAQQAGPAFAKHVTALEAIQPEDLPPGAIDANLGAPWLPVEDIHAFACVAFGVRDFHITVAHSTKEALWSVYGSRWACQTIGAVAEYGTDRANGVGLLELALNMKSPTIYDEHIIDGKKARILNQEETLAARDKQARLKEAFKRWVFSEPERTERMVRLYNDKFNNIRLRHFDGAHLQFPGMNPAIQLAQHQMDGVWRIMSSGNTLLAHAVGAGKTYTCMAAAMKMKQAGLIRKVLFAVPNHMLEQFTRECLQLYPNARFLMASSEDFTKEKRTLMTAKMASGLWDGIITTHSAFERIGLSMPYQERFLQEQIDLYEALLIGHERTGWDEQRANRNIIKSLEKQKARYAKKIEDLAAADKKDDGLALDDLGIDYLVIDEAQIFKNLDAPTKMERVAGIQSGGSERAFDLYMKARYLHEQHPGHGMTFASGTPISNTMVEMYTVQRYLDPEGLEAAGLEHFDAWAATFGEVVEMLEIAPDGKTLRPRSRFAKFVNLPELQQMFRSFADVQTADMLQLPTPTLAGGKAAVIACPMSETQRQLQQWLVKRYEDVRNGYVKPWEDNALAITTDGRKLALDARMVRADASSFVGAKTIALADNAYAIWNDTHDILGTQLIFCDLGVHPTAWGFSIYAEVMDQLVKRGLPRDQIAAVGEADTDGKKHALFEKVRQGRIRVLLGSTQKMGMGTNVQTRLIALHHLDAPWKPAEVEQREGRILRQGNRNPEVQVYRYVTEGSFDAFMWQALETKARFISQIMSGQSQAREAEDVSTQALSYAEVKAIASGNPAVLTLAQTDADLQRLRLLRKHHDDEQYVARLRIKHLPEDIERLSKRLAGLQQDAATAKAPWPAPFIIHQQPCTLEQAVEQVGAHLQQLPGLIPTTMNILLGDHRGLAFGVTVHPYAAPEAYVQGVTICRVGLARKFHGPRAILNAVTRLVEAYTESCRQVTQERQRLEAHLHAYATRIGADFPYAAYHDALAVLREQLSKALSLKPDPALPSLSSLMDQVAALHTTYSLDQAVMLPPTPRAVVGQTQAITTRIHALWAQQAPVGVTMLQPLLFNTLVDAQNKTGMRGKRLPRLVETHAQLPLL